MDVVVPNDETEAEFVAVCVGVVDPVPVLVPVRVLLDDWEAVCVEVHVAVSVPVAKALGVPVRVPVTAEVAVPVSVNVPVALGEFVIDGVRVSLGDAPTDGV